MNLSHGAAVQFGTFLMLVGSTSVIGRPHQLVGWSQTAIWYRQVVIYKHLRTAIEDLEKSWKTNNIMRELEAGTKYYHTYDLEIAKCILRTAEMMSTLGCASPTRLSLFIHAPGTYHQLTSPLYPEVSNTCVVEHMGCSIHDRCSLLFPSRSLLYHNVGRRTHRAH